MGWDPKQYALDLIAREGGPDNCTHPFTPAIDKPGPYKGKGNDNEWGERYADILSRLMAADIAVIEAEYDRACALFYPGGVNGHSYGAADRFWMGLRASFPSADFRIEHRIGRDDPMMPPRAAIRWSLHGRHDGWGAFGEPRRSRRLCHGRLSSRVRALGTAPRVHTFRRNGGLEADRSEDRITFNNRFDYEP